MWKYWRLSQHTHIHSISHASTNTSSFLKSQCLPVCFTLNPSMFLLQPQSHRFRLKGAFKCRVLILTQAQSYQQYQVKTVPPEISIHFVGCNRLSPLPCPAWYNKGLPLTESRKLVLEHGPKVSREGKKKKDIKKVLNKVQNPPWGNLQQSTMTWQQTHLLSLLTALRVMSYTETLTEFSSNWSHCWNRSKEDSKKQKVMG